MVQFFNLPAPTNVGTQLGEAISQGLGRGFETSTQQQFQRNQLRGALEQVQNLRSNPNATPYDLASSLLYATAGLPDQGRVVSSLYPLLFKQMEAERSQKVPMAGEKSFNAQVPQRQSLPEFGQTASNPLADVSSQNNKFFPNNIGPQEFPGNLPQAATEGQARPILNPNEMIPQARILAQERTKEGIPTTVKEAYEEIKGINEENKLYNQEVEKERQQRIESQKNYGEKASELLQNLMPDATDEQKAIFKKIGEEVAGRGKSEAEIERTLAKEASNFKNTISNIRNDLSAPRFYKELHRKFLGTDKDFQSAASDLRVKLKPLLDLGLYDTSRNLLSELGYYPEEREAVINPLNDRAKTALNFIPKAKIESKKLLGKSDLYPFGVSEDVYSDKQINQLANGIVDAFKEDPNISLVLLRKNLEDKGYNWRVFKDTLNQLATDKKINLNDDQFKQISYLDSPPLNNLEKILHSLNLIGR